MSNFIRRSQLITPFGVGSIIDLPEDSLMLLSTDYWVVDETTKVVDERLSRRLGVSGFNSPIVKPETNNFSSNGASQNEVMPFTRFPNVHFCSIKSCRKLKYVDSRKSFSGRCDCKYKAKLLPVRFVVACPDGHISDFPWFEWVHGQDRDHEQNCFGDVDDLKFFTSSGAGLASFGIKCTKCSKTRTLAGAGGKEALKNIPCRGESPWLGGVEGTTKQCSETPVLIQRGGSNVYFPNVVTSIKIPPYSKRANKIIEYNLGKLSEEPVIDGELSLKHEIILDLLATQNKISVDELINAYKARLDDDEDNGAQSISEDEFRHAEYEAFIKGGLGQIGDDLRTKEEKIEDLGRVKNFFDKLILVEKLVETRALSSFSRLTPATHTDKRACSISRNKNLNWLPAINAVGEGIFISINQKILAEWAQRRETKDRALRISQSMEKSTIYSRRSGEKIDASFILLHTLSHILIRRLAFDCGYGSSSLKERIYSGNVNGQLMSGILIYAADTSADGTLGGLIAMGSPKRFEDVLVGALEDCLNCSNDPLCMDSFGQGPGSLNLSACHACALVPETSCEESNCFLDRGMLVGSSEKPMIGFFSEIFEKF